MGKWYEFFATEEHQFGGGGYPAFYKYRIPTGAFVVVRDMPNLDDFKAPAFSEQEDARRTNPEATEGWTYTDGWNGSFHAASYDPHLVAWAEGPGCETRARELLRAVRASYKRHEQEVGARRRDSAVARFEARRQVRFGD